MRSENWQRIIKLDDERRLIETRIRLRSKKHHGVPWTHDEDTLMRGAPPAYQDAVRYIEIQDAQWLLMGSDIGYKPEPNQSIPI